MVTFATSGRSRTIDIVWDVAGDDPKFEASLVAEMDELDRRFQQYAERPGLIRKGVVQLITLGVAVAMVAMLFSAELNDATPYVALAGFFPALLYAMYIADFQTDLVKNQLARSQGWIYGSNPDRPRWQLLRTRFPELFDRGNSEQYLTDQFWGAGIGNDRRTPFWIGELHSAIQRGKTRTTHHDLMIAVQLEKAMTHDIHLKPEGVSILGKDPLRSRDVELESNEFNRAFVLDAHPDDRERRKAVFQAMNPALMATLLDFSNEHGTFDALFRSSTFIVRLPNQVLRPKYTNFLRRVEIDERDVTLFRDRLQGVLNFAHRIRNQLD